MLLTSSQVSVALSTTIVIFFTTALFLSGYVIQQRTVRNLRRAIRPNPSPQIYLPDRFRDDTTELADGTIVVLDEYNRPVRQRTQLRAPDGQILHGEFVNEDKVDRAEVVVEIKETPPEEVFPEGQQQQKVMAVEAPGGEDVDIKLEERQGQDDQPEAKPQPAPWEVRAEEVAPGGGHVEDPNDETKKPISRAERRRLIKEEIARLSQVDEPMYYQRRLW